MSNINPNNIDKTYPVAGQDNDTQGFRTNFTNIRNNLQFAKNELDDLQGKAVLKSPLSGSTLNNNMAGSVLQAPELQDVRETRVDFGTVNGTLELNHTSAHNFTATSNGSISLSFTGFPAAGKVGRIQVEIEIANANHTLQFPSSVSKGVEGLAGYDSATGIIEFPVAGFYQFAFWSDDGGTTIHVNDLSRNRTDFQSDSIKMMFRTPDEEGSPGDVEGMVAIDGDYIYVCIGSYDGSTGIWKRAALSSF